jgi:hypothetical protein
MIQYRVTAKDFNPMAKGNDPSVPDAYVDPKALADLQEAEHSSEHLDIERIKKLAGLDSGAKGDGAESPLTHGGSEKGEFMKKNNIEPGTDAWFKLWFAQPKLTGENPYGPA